MECVAGIECNGNTETIINIPVEHHLGSGLCVSFANRPNVESWCLGDAVVGAWCSRRRGMLKTPLADATVKIIDFPGEYEPFILKSP